MDRTFELVIKDTTDVVDMESMDVDITVAGFLSGTKTENLFI